MLRHLVMIKASETASEEQIVTVFRKIADLKSKIPGIISFEAGENCSTESLAQGFTHAFMMDFTDSGSRDAYLPHPDHVAVQQPLKSILSDDEDSILVLDFEF